MVAKIQVVFWDVMPCSVMVRYHHSRGPCYLHADGGSKIL